MENLAIGIPWTHGAFAVKKLPVSSDNIQRGGSYMRVNLTFE
jgi:hypothetical protein